MGVYAYCVVPADHRPPAGLEGLAGGAVRALSVGELAVWVSDVAARPPLELDAVTRHHEVVRSAAAAGAVAPIRFGAWAAAEPVLRRRVEASRADLVSMLRAVEGAVELGLRIADASTAGTDPATVEGETGGDGGQDGGRPGRAYLRLLAQDRARRRARRRRQDELARCLLERLSPLVREQRVHYLERPEVVALAHLVCRKDEIEYRSRIAAFAREMGCDLEIDVSGPWPPYSFACPT